MISIRIPEKLKSALSQAAALENERISPYAVKILGCAPGVQRILIDEPPPQKKQQWTIDEIGMALLSQLALIGLGIERLSDVLSQDIKAQRPADVLMVCSQLRRIEELLVRLRPLTAVQQRKSGN